MLTEDQAFAYLSDKHTTLWGDWTIEDPDRRRKAAAWLAREANAAHAHARGPGGPLYPTLQRAQESAYRRLYDAQLPGGV